MSTRPSSIPRELFSLAAPVIGLNVLSVATLAVDTAMCGRLPNAEVVLTALGYATQIVFLLLIAMMGLTVGTVALVARAYGAGDSERVNHVLRQSTLLTIAVGAGVGVVGNLIAPLLLRALGGSGEVLDAGLAYLRPLLAGTVFYYLNILYAAVLRGCGNTRLAFLVAIGTNLLNVVLDYGLILGELGMPALGVAGAAIGTVISYCCGAIAMIVMLRRGAMPGLTVRLRPARIDRALARQLFRIGWPASLDMLILNASFLSILGMLGRIHPDAVAAHGVGLRIQAIAFVPGLGVSQATAAMVGQALGARDADRARAVARASVTLCTAIMSTLALAIVVLAHPIVAIFNVAAGTTLEGYAIDWMRLLGYCMPAAGVNIALVGVLQGAGATNISLAINFLGTAVLQVPLSALLGFGLGLGAFGVWLAFPVAFVVKAGLGAAAYRRGRWARLGKEI